MQVPSGHVMLLTYWIVEMGKTMTTTSVVFSERQMRFLKEAAARDMLEGKAPTASVSAKIRAYVDEKMEASKLEVEAR